MSFITKMSSDEALVGAKAAKLALLNTIGGINVPPFFVITTDAFNHVIGSSHSRIRRLDGLTADSQEIQAIAQEIQGDLLSRDISESLTDSVCSAYHEFSQLLGAHDTIVSVRSSATAEDGTMASFAGQYTTCLNVQGTVELLKAIQRVWASTYSAQAISYRIKHGYAHQKAHMAVIVQKMIDAVSAGTIYTIDPETGAPTICINAVDGLGFAEVSGEITPVSWVIDPQSLVVIKRRSPKRRTLYPLDTGTLRDLVQQVKKISAYFKDNWQIPFLEAEFACDSDEHIYFTQVRPETVWSNGKAYLTAVDLDRASHVPRIFQGGSTGCPGVASGILRVVNSIDEAEAAALTGDILVTPNTTNVWERVFGRIGGIITDIGGTGSHTAVVMREIGKPAIVGAGRAMQTLSVYDGSRITLDATQRIIFAGLEASEITHQLKTIVPTYGTEDRQSKEEVWAEADRLPGRTSTDVSGLRWINKPDYPACQFMQSVYLEAHQWIGKRLQTPIKNEINANIHRIAFENLFQWRTKLRQMGLDALEELHDEREKSFSNYLKVSRNFELKHEIIEKWLSTYIRLNAFIGLGFDIYKVTEGLLEAALSQKKILEPYYTQIRSARQETGDLESSHAAHDLYLLADEVENNPLLAEVLRAACALHDDALINKEAYKLFYIKLERHAYNYKVTYVAEINQSRTEAVLAAAGEILKILGGCRKRPYVSYRVSSDKNVQYFPYHPYLQRVHRLALASEKARQDSHHLRVRGHWLIRKKLEELGAFLKKKGRIGSFPELFDYPHDWFLTQVSEYEKSTNDSQN